MSSEEETLPICGNGAAMYQQGVEIQQEFCEGSLDGLSLQEGVRKHTGFKAISVGFFQKVSLLKGDILPGDDHRKLRFFVG